MTYVIFGYNVETFRDDHAENLLTANFSSFPENRNHPLILRVNPGTSIWASFSGSRAIMSNDYATPIEALEPLFTKR